MSKHLLEILRLAKRRVKMQHPYQCIATVNLANDEASDGDYLLAACGPKLLMVSAIEGKVTSSWSSAPNAVSSKAAPTSVSGTDKSPGMWRRIYR